MDSFGKWTTCQNSTFGCTFGTSCVVEMVKHFRWDCAFHPVHCFKCSTTVGRANFEKHDMGHYKHNPAQPCPAPEEVPDLGREEAIRTMSREQHLLRECVRECTLGLESLGRVMKDVAAEMKGLKAEQEDLKTFVKRQLHVSQNFHKAAAEKVNSVQESVNDLVTRLDKDAETIVQRVERVNDVVNHLEKDVRSAVERVENVDGFMKESFRETMLGVGNLSHVMENVAADVAAVKLGTGEQKDVMEKLEKTLFTCAEQIDKVQQGIGTTVERVEKVNALVKEVGVLTRPLEDQSRIHWYLKNLSDYIVESKTRISFAESGVFVVRGYSAKLGFALKKSEAGLSLGIYFLLCPGPNDSLLKWPFRTPFTLSLIHPYDASETKEHKIHPAQAIYPQKFGGPNRVDVTVGGTSSLCSVEEAQNEGFIENDALCFALTLHE